MSGFNDKYGWGSPVIVIEPTRSSSSSSPGSAPTPPRPPEVTAESVAGGKGAREWVKTELAWTVGHFVRALFTVVVYRVFHHAFNKGIASEQAYDQGPDLWTLGKRERGFRRGAGGAAYYASSTSYSTTEKRNGNGSSASDFFRTVRPERTTEPPWSYGRAAAPPDEDRTTDRDRMKLAKVGPYVVYDNRTVIDRATQFWPCPLLYRCPCEECRFCVADPGGVNHCAAVAKQNQLREGKDDGFDLEEIADQIERGR